VVDNSDSCALIYGEVFSQAVEDIKGDLPKVKHYICCGSDQATQSSGVGNKELPEGALSYNQIMNSGEDSEPLVDVEEEDDAFIVYTSGTTGFPKGAVSTHRQQMMGSINAIIALQLTSEDRFLFNPPLFHQGGVTLGICYPLMNATIVIPDYLAFDPTLAMELIEKEKVTGAFFVAAMGNAIMLQPDLDRFDLSSWNMWISTGGIFPVALKEKIFERWPDIRLYDIYGMTEMVPVFCTNGPEGLRRHPDSVGKPVPFMDPRIVEDDDQDVPPGEPGELIVRGLSIMKGYYGNPEATADTNRGGWFHSGDVMSKDEEGYYYIVDRKKDMIVTGAENVYPAEVENAILENPKVLECAVIGVADKKWGEIVKAIVVLKPGESMDEEELKGFLAERLASYKRPRELEFIDALPRNAMGKVLKTELREKHGKLIQY
jgi:fatty-acyl-CoA synthase